MLAIFSHSVYSHSISSLCLMAESAIVTLDQDCLYCVQSVIKGNCLQFDLDDINVQGCSRGGSFPPFMKTIHDYFLHFFGYINLF